VPEDAEQGLSIVDWCPRVGVGGGGVLGLPGPGFLIKGLSSQPRPSDSSGGRPARRQTQHVGLRALRGCLPACPQPTARCPREGPDPAWSPPRFLPSSEVLVLQIGQLSGAWDEAGVLSVALALSLSLRASGTPPGPGLGTAAALPPPAPAPQP